MRSTSTLLTAVVLLGTAATAHAGPGEAFGLAAMPVGDDDEDGVDDDELVSFVQLHLALQFGPGPDYPYSLSPDIRYSRGRFELGLLHSPEAITGFSGLSSGSVCIHDCAAFSSPYHGGALQAGYRLFGDASMLTLQAAAVVSEIDPFDLGFKVGGELLYLLPEALLLTAKPNLIIAQGADASRLDVPVSIGFLWFFQFESGVTMPLDHGSERWQVPLSLKLAYPVRNVMVDLAFTFPALAGGSEVDTGGENMTLTLGVDLTPWINGW